MISNVQQGGSNQLIAQAARVRFSGGLLVGYQRGGVVARTSAGVYTFTLDPAPLQLGPQSATSRGRINVNNVITQVFLRTGGALNNNDYEVNWNPDATGQSSVCTITITGGNPIAAADVEFDFKVEQCDLSGPNANS